MTHRWAGAVLLLAAPAFAQVTATVTDTDGQAWAGGKWTAQLVSPSTTSPTIAGAPVSLTPLRGILDGAGSFSATLTPSTALDQSGAYWIFTIAPNATYGAPVTVTTPIGSATQNLSALLSKAAQAPRFRPGSGVFGYNDTEASVGPFPAGSTYFNVTSNVLRQWNGTGWTGATGGGSGGVALPPSVPVISTDPSGTARAATATQIAATLGNPNAVVDTTNAANVTFGVLPLAQVPTIPAGRVSGLGPLATASQIPASAVTGLAPSATTDTTNAGNITTGTLPSARLPATGVTPSTVGSATQIPVLTFDATGRLTAVTTATVAAGAALPANVPVVSTNAQGVAGAATAAQIATQLGNPNATVDTTNASAITRGTLPAAQLPASGVAAGTYGSSTQVPVTTYDAAGRATGVTLATIAASGGTSNPAQGAIGVPQLSNGAGVNAADPNATVSTSGSRLTFFPGGTYPVSTTNSTAADPIKGGDALWNSLNIFRTNAAGRNEGNGNGVVGSAWYTAFMHEDRFIDYTAGIAEYQTANVQIMKHVGDTTLMKMNWNYTPGGCVDASGECFKGYFEKFSPIGTYKGRVTGTPAVGAIRINTTYTGGCDGQNGSGGDTYCSGGGGILLQTSNPVFTGSMIAYTPASIALGTITTAASDPAINFSPNGHAQIAGGIPDTTNYLDGDTITATISGLVGTPPATGTACYSAPDASYTEQMGYSLSGTTITFTGHRHKGIGTGDVYFNECRYAAGTQDTADSGGNRVEYTIVGSTDAHTMVWASHNKGARAPNSMGKNSFTIGSAFTVFPGAAVIDTVSQTASPNINNSNANTNTGDFHLAVNSVNWASGNVEQAYEPANGFEVHERYIYNPLASTGIIRAVDHDVFQGGVDFLYWTEMNNSLDIATRRGPIAALHYYGTASSTNGVYNNAFLFDKSPYGANGGLLNVQACGVGDLDPHCANTGPYNVFIHGNTPRGPISLAADPSTARFILNGLGGVQINGAAVSGSGSIALGMNFGGPAMMDMYNNQATAPFGGLFVSAYNGRLPCVSFVSPTQTTSNASLCNTTSGQLNFNVPGGLLVNGAPIGTGSSATPAATATAPGTVQLAAGQTSNTLSKAATTGSYADLLNIPPFSAVATSGSYADLLNKPTIPVQQLFNGTAYNAINVNGNLIGTVDNTGTLQLNNTATGAATPHIITGGAVPTVATGAASTGCTIAGTDSAFTLTCTTGATPAAGTLATVTFAAAFANAPRGGMSANNALSAVAMNDLYASKTTIGITVGVPNALAANGSYSYDFVLAQ